MPWCQVHWNDFEITVTYTTDNEDTHLYGMSTVSMIYKMFTTVDTYKKYGSFKQKHYMQTPVHVLCLDMRTWKRYIKTLHLATHADAINVASL